MLRILIPALIAACLLAYALPMGRAAIANHINISSVKITSVTTQGNVGNSTYSATMNWTASVINNYNFNFASWTLSALGSQCSGFSGSVVSSDITARSLTLTGIPDTVGSCKLRLTLKQWSNGTSSYWYFNYDYVITSLPPLGPTPTPDPNAPPVPTPTPAYSGARGSVGYTMTLERRQCGDKFYVLVHIRGGAKLINLQKTAIDVRPASGGQRDGSYTGNKSDFYFSKSQNSSLRAQDTVMLVIDTGHADYPGAHTLGVWGLDDRSQPNYVTQRVETQIGASPEYWQSPRYTDAPPKILSSDIEEGYAVLHLGLENLNIRTDRGDYPANAAGTPTPTPNPDWNELPSPRRNNVWDILLDNDRGGLVTESAFEDEHFSDSIQFSLASDDEIRSYAARAGVCLLLPTNPQPFAGAGALGWISVVFPAGRDGETGPLNKYELLIDGKVTVFDFKPFDYYTSPWTGTSYVRSRPAEETLQPPGGSSTLGTRPVDHRIEGAVEDVMRAVNMNPGSGDGQTPASPFVLGFCLLLAVGAALGTLLLGGGFEHGIHPVRVFLATCVFVLIWSGLGFAAFGVPFSLAVAPLLLPLTSGAAVIIYGR